MSKTIDNLIGADKLPLGTITIIDQEAPNWISCTTRFVQRGIHIVGESQFRVYIDRQLICLTPYLDYAVKVFEQPELITE